MAKKKLNSVLGVDIGSQSMKIAEIRVNGREISVSALGSVPTPAGLVDHTGVYDTDTLGPMLKQLCDEAGSTVKAAVISIAGQASVLVRTIEIPKTDGKELDVHMEWEISRNIPFAESTVLSDYKSYATKDPNSANMDVVMAIAPQSAIDTLMGIAKKAGKTIHAIDVEPLSLSRLLKTNYESEVGNDVVCVIEIGHKTTAINMYRDGQLLLPRQIPVGGEVFTNAIAGSLSISAEEAEERKVNSLVVPSSVGGAAPAANPFMVETTGEFAPYNPFMAEEESPAPAPDYSEPAAYNPADDQPAPYDPMQEMPPAYSSPFGDEADASPTADSGSSSMAPVAADPAPASGDSLFQAISGELDEFVAEIRRSIDYFRSRGGDVQRVYVAGGGSKMEGLREMLERSLGVGVEPLDPFRGMSVTAKKLDFGVLEQNRESFAVAVGNALHIAFD